MNARAFYDFWPTAPSNDDLPEDWPFDSCACFYTGDHCNDWEMVENPPAISTEEPLSTPPWMARNIEESRLKKFASPICAPKQHPVERDFSSISDAAPRPILRLVPKDAPCVQRAPLVEESSPTPVRGDRRMALIEARELLAFVLETSDDGYTRADLLPYVHDIESLAKRLRRDLKGRRGLLETLCAKLGFEPLKPLK